MTASGTTLGDQPERKEVILGNGLRNFPLCAQLLPMVAAAPVDSTVLGLWLVALHKHTTDRLCFIPG